MSQEKRDERKPKFADGGVVKHSDSVEISPGEYDGFGAPISNPAPEDD